MCRFTSSECGWVFVSAHGTVFEEQGVCSPQLVFPLLLWEVRRVRGSTFNYLPLPSHPIPPSATGHGMHGRTGVRRKGLRPPCFWTSLSVPASSPLASISLSNSSCLSLSLSLSPASLASPLRVAAFFEVCGVCLFPWVSFRLDVLWWSHRVVMKRGG